jgi:hypothetical protein
LATIVSKWENEELAPIVGFVLPFAFYTALMHEIGAFDVIAEAEQALAEQDRAVSATMDEFYKSGVVAFDDDDDDDEIVGELSLLLSLSIF